MCYIRRLLHAVNEDDPEQRVQFCEWFRHKVHDDVELVSKTVWPDEATSKLNGTVTRHNCGYWAPENPHVRVGKTVNIPGLNVWYGLSYKDLIGPVETYLI
jgi:hypothetical protein